MLIVPVAQGAAGQDNSSDRPFVYTVRGVPPGDLLTVRKKPRANAPVVGKLPNGAQGFMTLDGCFNSKTGRKIPADKVDMRKPNTWCAIQFGDDGQYGGFVRAKFLQ
jgi:hypothetical protein